jgi:hypothetical protein
MGSSGLSEIDEYLKLPVDHVKNPLKWWFNNRTTYPNLSRMALDYLSLSIPGKQLLLILFIADICSSSYVDSS